VDWSGREIHLVYYPPYHSKYNGIERCWSWLQQKWNGVLLTCWDIFKACVQRMTWKGQHPTVVQFDGDYPLGVIVPKKEMIELNKRLERSETPAKYDIIIRPTIPRGRSFISCGSPEQPEPSRSCSADIAWNRDWNTRIAGKPQVAKCTGQPISKRQVIHMINHRTLLI